ncbi:MAG: serine hydrolase [Anaerolineae bacterium]|nr:serine hydrolase [Anaerolineae bacterium]NUQ07248.1 serine hydrolase [Anaerolineae bacterium]
MLRKSLLLLVALMSLAISAVQAQEAPSPVGIDTVCGEGALTIIALDEMPEDATTQALDTILRQLVTLPTDELPPLSAVQPKPPAPGAVIFVDSPEGRYFRSIGAVDIESCAFVNPAMGFPIGSNTKMFTAAVIFQLHEEGLLSTSDLVSQYLPDEIALWDGAESITIDMLLGHTSGLPDYLDSQDPMTLGGRYEADDWDVLGQTYTPQELVTQAASQPLVFAPGTEAQWAYSNTGYIMLGQIIEQVTGKTYIEAVTERVIERLGMANTVLVADFPPAELGLATQYIASPFTVNTSGWNFTQAWSAGNAVSTPEDMAIFLRAYYTGALYQNPETLEAMMTRAAPGNTLESEDFYYLHGGYYKGGFLGHGGQTLGTESDVGYHPATDTVVVTWANSSESGTGRGIYHIGHALGITPTWDEVYSNLPAVASQPTFEDVVGLTLELSGVVVAGTQEQKAPAEGSTYSAIFNADGTMNIVADCNTVMASYTTGDASAITIELGASTRVACPEGSIADDFLNVLGEASGYSIFSIGDLLLVVIATPDQSNVSFTTAQ